MLVGIAASFTGAEVARRNLLDGIIRRCLGMELEWILMEVMRSTKDLFFMTRVRRVASTGNIRVEAVERITVKNLGIVMQI